MKHVSYKTIRGDKIFVAIIDVTCENEISR